MAKTSIPDCVVGKDLFDFLVTNKKILIAEKKFEVKLCDAFRMSNFFVDKHGDITKDAPIQSTQNADVIERACVINTTNWMDSHSDVHIPGLWKKSLAETKGLYLLQEHKMSFAGIITEDLQAFTKSMSWKSLGLDASGSTEALIFNAMIGNKRNPYMFDQYMNNYVKNHSVGMQYVNLELAINDPDYKEEFTVWNKYIGQIANADDAEEQGYFWAVKEAKIIEGSAVPIGSNRITPTLNSDTGKQPLFGTDKQPSLKELTIEEILMQIKIF